MHKPRTRQIGTIVALAAIAVLFFNYFEHVLESSVVSAVPVWLVTPFVLLLLAIATGPFVNKSWWEHHYPAVSAVLGAVVVGYYVYPLSNVSRIVLTLYDYVSFISLIGSLFVVAGGIHFNLRGKAAPWENVVLLGAGAVLSNVLGTTGASMLLVRPYLRSNKFRIKGYHVVFFIFIVSNIGGALTPIGDPPLFLGFLKGVPFFWVVTKAWFAWALVLGLLLVLFYAVDRFHFRRVSHKKQEEAIRPEEVRISGLHNVWFLATIIAAVFVERPLMLREVIMWSAAMGSYYTTRKEVHGRNEFNFLPLKEVAVLFLGIFATMIPALDWLEMHAAVLGIKTPGQFFFTTGVLSSVLDNAPTYLSFLSAAFGLHGASIDNAAHMHVLLGSIQASAAGLTNPLSPGAMAVTNDSWRYVQAISLGAVFFGAMTYIGNGPNFMVKSIADQAGVKSPSFFEYVWKYSVPVLLPIFIIVWYLLF
ncbi:MAG: sodium:proton antiporter [Ignavibacteriales bacterium]|nr:sodium:proton antiporter [Ignavibacteriales bacterium]